MRSWRWRGQWGREALGGGGPGAGVERTRRTQTGAPVKPGRSRPRLRDGPRASVLSIFWTRAPNGTPWGRITPPTRTRGGAAPPALARWAVRGSGGGGRRRHRERHRLPWRGARGRSPTSHGVIDPPMAREFQEPRQGLGASPGRPGDSLTGWPRSARACLGWGSEAKRWGPGRWWRADGGRRGAWSWPPTSGRASMIIPLLISFCCVYADTSFL